MRGAGEVVVSAMLTVGPFSAVAQTACAPRSNIIEHLTTRYSETPVVMGIANNGGVIKLLSTDSGTNWTLIITMPNGTSA